MGRRARVWISLVFCGLLTLGGGVAVTESIVDYANGSEATPQEVQAIVQAPRGQDPAVVEAELAALDEGHPQDFLVAGLGAMAVGAAMALKTLSADAGYEREEKE